MAGISLTVHLEYDEVAESPTVDAVPVVRCKDYVHCEAEMCRNSLGLLEMVKPLDFCSYGERKDDYAEA